MKSKVDPETTWRRGFVVEVTEDLGAFHHVFGGTTWSAESPRDAQLGRPALLARLDCSDPRLAVALEGRSGELPLFAHLNYEGLLSVQEYRIDEASKHATFTRVDGDAVRLAEADRLSVPLSEKNLELRTMRPEEVCDSEEAYWVAIDSFLGGSSFFRVGGSPIWIDKVEDPGEDYRYLCSIGYESVATQFLEVEPFYCGEVAHYFFVRERDSRVRVVVQVS